MIPFVKVRCSHDHLIFIIRIYIHAKIYWKQNPGPWFNIKMLSYQYRKSHCGDKTILRLSYLHKGISFTGKMASLYWIGPLDPPSESGLTHIHVLCALHLHYAAAPLHQRATQVTRTSRLSPDQKQIFHVPGRASGGPPDGSSHKVIVNWFFHLAR